MRFSRLESTGLHGPTTRRVCAIAAGFFDLAAMAPTDRNLLVVMRLLLQAHCLFSVSWAGKMRHMVAQCRATHDLWAVTPALVELLNCLPRGSTEFVTWWQRHGIRSGSVGHKLLQHPVHGATAFCHVTFQAKEEPALRLAIYVLEGGTSL